jgi:hypothetical protein
MSPVTAIIIMIIVLFNRTFSMTQDAVQKRAQMYGEFTDFAWYHTRLRLFARLQHSRALR